MIYLGVESSSPVFSVAVSDGSKGLSFLQVQGQGRPSSLLTDLIEQALKEAGCSLDKVEVFALSMGPGSFTGLRIGVMTVKTLAWALKKPVLPISSLEVIAQNAAGGGKEVFLFLDARKGNVYIARFARQGPELERRSPDLLLTPAEALAGLRGPVWVIGDGLKKYGPLVEQGAAQGWSPAPEEWGIPRADHLCRVAAVRWPRARVDDAHSLVPQYLYSQESDITGK